MSENTFTNRLTVARTFKQDNGGVRLLGTFCGGLYFPKDGGKPFNIVERNSKNGKTFKQVRATLVISPDNRKSDKGYAASPIFYDGKNMTFKEFLDATGVELVKDKLYVTVSMDRGTMGLYQLMADPTLDFKANILCSGELSIYEGKNDGKMHAAIGNVSLFARDHVFDDKVDKANAGCQLNDSTGANSGGGQSQSAPAYNAPAGGGYNAQCSGGFVEIDDDDGELPF